MTPEPRYIVMSVPMNGEGAYWFAFDTYTRKAEALPNFEAARARVCQLNKFTEVSNHA